MILLIEGDNGTGKDTLAQGLQASFDIVTYHEEIQDQLRHARAFAGRENAMQFLACNEICSRIMADNAQKGVNSLAIRYWPSTIAAAYADGKLSEVECDSLMEQCIEGLAMPDIIVYLECSHDERVHRIEVRNSSNFDDKTVERANRYAYYSNKVLQRLGNRVHRVQTSGKSRESVQNEVRGFLNQWGRKCVA